MSIASRPESAPISKTEARRFGIGLAVAACVIGSTPLLHGLPVRPWPLMAAAGVTLAAIFRPMIFRPLMGAVRRGLGNGALAIAYFGVMTPVAFCMRLAGRDALRLKFEPESESYWIERPPGDAAADHLRRPY